MGKFRILCVDDDADFLVGMRMQLEDYFEFTSASSLDEALSLIGRIPIDLVVLDVELGLENGIDGVRAIRQSGAPVDIAMLSGQRDPRVVVEAIRAGAVDYIVKPVAVEELLAICERQSATRRVRERYDALVETQNSNGHRSSIIHRSESIARILRQAEQLRGHGANVLIVGETGTGKELLARYIHRLEGDIRRPFIAVNCAAIPENLIEAELFGAEAGAYTGSIKRRIGKFELADGGDIFLDEIGSLRPGLQAKILRVLQEGEFCRLGGNEMVRASFRVIAATNEPLEEGVKSGDFRMDLYHRIRVIQLTMPPLRERAEDIPLLIAHFLSKFSKGEAPKRFSVGAMDRLTSYPWPGNVRELANVVQSLIILAHDDVIGEEVFPSWCLNGCGRASSSEASRLPSVSDSVGALKDYVARAEKHYIECALRESGGDKSKAARTLAMGRTTLYAKMKELGMMQ
ncbi:MAG TPA: sigma-54 dependent transcriptional regulator [bacterium]|nr:sigma-54 dependent transcriptional regulator [bacterium]